MLSELDKLMAYAAENDNYQDALNQNVTGKKSSSGVIKTSNYLKTLYRFDINYPPFQAFKYFWNISDSNSRPLLALVYAVYQDELLAESIQVLRDVKLGHKASIHLFEEKIEQYHPKQYSTNTRTSMAQNIASSWKQAGFIEGKVRNIRIQPEILAHIACFAFLLSYLHGDRGEFILKSTVVSALCLSENKLRELAHECVKKDLMHYQHAGSVTSISFDKLLLNIGLNGF